MATLRPPAADRPATRTAQQRERRARLADTAMEPAPKPPTPPLPPVRALVRCGPCGELVLRGAEHACPPPFGGQPAGATREETVPATAIQPGDQLELAGRWRTVRDVRRTAEGARRVELDQRDVLVLRPNGPHTVRRAVRRTAPPRVGRWPGDRPAPR